MCIYTHTPVHTHIYPSQGALNKRDRVRGRATTPVVARRPYVTQGTASGSLGVAAGRGAALVLLVLRGEGPVLEPPDSGAAARDKVDQLRRAVGVAGPSPGGGGGGTQLPWGGGRTRSPVGGRGGGVSARRQVGWATELMPRGP